MKEKTKEPVGGTGNAAPPPPAANGLKLRAKNFPVLFGRPPVRDVDPYFGCKRGFWNEEILPTELNGFKPAQCECTE